MEKISDELLAAFLDGNVTSREAESVLAAIAEDDELREIVEFAQAVDAASTQSTLPLQSKAAADQMNACAMRCELFILRDRGIERSEEEWMLQAQRQGWLSEDGTALYNIGRMLEQECFSLARTFHNTLDDVKRALVSGSSVIAVVDFNELTDDLNKLAERTDEDVEQGFNPNHAVVLKEFLDGMVRFYDPQRDSIEIIPEEFFQSAWDDSQCYMVEVRSRDLGSYEPHPIDLTDVDLPAGLVELREAIAENAHEVWAAARKRQGWTYGPKRDDDKKQTPDMVPYCDLAESEKEYDRDMAENTIKLLIRLGYKIEKK